MILLFLYEMIVSKRRV
ncbi:MAG: hypothetical protein L0H09_02680 [Psychrobacter sp.]|nr:hypothetical protein [Psychrobacter sp.]